MKCYLCQNKDDFKILFKAEPGKIVKCRNCSLVFIEPRPSEKKLSQAYEKDYFFSDRARDYGYMNYLEEKDNFFRTFKKRKSIIDRYKTKGTLLDVGCAAGFFLLVMKESGWNVYGTDISVCMSKIAKNKFGLRNVYNSLLEKAAFKKAQFDVITFWDTIEHLSDPLKELKISHNLLKDDGILVIETQNVRSLFNKIFRQKWHHFKHEEHLFHFSPGTLKTLLEKAGFSIVKQKVLRAGRYVSWEFIVERMQRFNKFVYDIARNMKFLNGKSVYINPLDEMIAVARKKQ